MVLQNLIQEWFDYFTCFGMIKKNNIYRKTKKEGGREISIKIDPYKY